MQNARDMYNVIMTALAVHVQFSLEHAGAHDTHMNPSSCARSWKPPRDIHMLCDLWGTLSCHALALELHGAVCLCSCWNVHGNRQQTTGCCCSNELNATMMLTTVI